VRKRVAEDVGHHPEPRHQVPRPGALAADGAEVDQALDLASHRHRHRHDGLDLDPLQGRLVDVRFGRELVEPRDDDGVPAGDLPDAPGIGKRIRARGRRPEVDVRRGPRMRDERLAGLRRETAERAAVETEEVDDAPQGVGDRGIDPVRREVDEPGGELRQQPLERPQLAVRRRTGAISEADFRTGHGE